MRYLRTILLVVAVLAAGAHGASQGDDFDVLRFDDDFREPPVDAGLRNLFALYEGIADTWQLFDNSGVGEPRLVASGRAGHPARILDAVAWANLRERQA